MIQPQCWQLWSWISSNSCLIGAGRYRHQFTRPGVYYYWSGLVDINGAIWMRGKVNVTEKFSYTQNVIVRVGEFEAVYNVSTGTKCSLFRREIYY